MHKPLSQAHPWHGIEIHPDSPKTVNSFIEIVPSDSVKFEIHKPSGFLKIDRPQKYSNFIPALYGFIPQTYCGDTVAAFAMEKTGIKGWKGDGDPLDICVITERNINCGNIIAEAIPIGGFRMIDKNEVDDKIVAVLKGDAVFGDHTDMNELPANLIERLEHYFLTYKLFPGASQNVVEIRGKYGREEAFEVIQRSYTDYKNL